MSTNWRHFLRDMLVMQAIAEAPTPTVLEREVLKAIAQRYVHIIGHLKYDRCMWVNV